tara:strand:- start:898 stop:1236 length:339 start_codon:yes stop_codon:yes gene_type:complete
MKLFSSLLLCASLANAQVITDITIDASIAQSNVPITFGQVFKEGDLPAGYGVTLLNRTSIVQSQLDIKATHKDGSVRHGIISTIIPFLAAGTTKLLIYKIKLVDVAFLPKFK